MGDPAQRLSEDGLRILRAYRFMDAGPHRMVPDEGLRHALATHADMLDRISKERIWTEFRRILSGIDPSGTLHRMQVDGALGHVFRNASWTWTRSCTSEMGLRMRSFD